MVKGKQEHVVLISQLEELHSDHEALCQIKSVIYFFHREAISHLVALARRKVLQVDDRQWNGQGRNDHPRRMAAHSPPQAYQLIADGSQKLGRLNSAFKRSSHFSERWFLAG